MSSISSFLRACIPNMPLKRPDTGKHVWCEKPMAKTAEECQAIIDACKQNKVKLSIGYRMQHEPNTQKIIEWSKTKPYRRYRNGKGRCRFQHRPTLQILGVWMPNWAGDLSMMSACTVSMRCDILRGMEPIAVTGHYENTRPEVFKEVAETTIFDLDFPEGIQAHGKTTAAENVNILRADCEKGWYELSPFQAYNGVQGKASDGTLLDTLY